MKKHLDLLKQFIKFGIIGVSNTLVSLAVYYALVHFGMHYLPANVAGFVLGTLNSYYWNNKFVFRRTDGHLRTIAKMYVCYTFTFLLSSGLLVLQIEYFDISEYIAPLVNIPITMIINFCINKLWVFK
jgi:putative flippase GtrA